MHCGLGLGVSYGVQFVTARGTVLDAYVEDGGCLGADVSSGGQWWQWNRWDLNGDVRAEIVRDLATH